MDVHRGKSLQKNNHENCPFGLAWLDSCYQQTLLPNGPWNEKVHRMLNYVMSFYPSEVLLKWCYFIMSKNYYA